MRYSGTASDVAQCIIQSRQAINKPPSHLALQKLLYFIQRDWMHEAGGPLFNEDFEAWQFGPVIPKIYKAYQLYGSSPIWAYYEYPANLPPNVQEFIKQKVVAYKDLSPWELVNATHKFGTAWSAVWADGSGKGNVIPKSSIMKEANG